MDEPKEPTLCDRIDALVERLDRALAEVESSAEPPDQPSAPNPRLPVWWAPPASSH